MIYEIIEILPFAYGTPIWALAKIAQLNHACYYYVAWKLRYYRRLYYGRCRVLAARPMFRGMRARYRGTVTAVAKRTGDIQFILNYKRAFTERLLRENTLDVAAVYLLMSVPMEMDVGVFHGAWMIRGIANHYMQIAEDLYRTDVILHKRMCKVERGEIPDEVEVLIAQVRTAGAPHPLMFIKKVVVTFWVFKN